MSWSSQWSSRLTVTSLVSQGLNQVTKLKEDVEKQFDDLVSTDDFSSSIPSSPALDSSAPDFEDTLQDDSEQSVAEESKCEESIELCAYQEAFPVWTADADLEKPHTEATDENEAAIAVSEDDTNVEKDEIGQDSHTLLKTEDDNSLHTDDAEELGLSELQSLLRQREQELAKATASIIELHKELDNACNREVTAVERNQLLSLECEKMKQILELNGRNESKNLQNALGSAQTQIKILQKAVVAKEKMLADLLEEGNGLSVNQARLEQRVRQLLTDKNESQSRCAAFKEQLEKTQRQFAESSAMVSDLEAAKKHLADHVQELESKTASSQESLQSLHAELEEERRNALHIKADMESLQSRHEQLQLQIQNTKNLEEGYGEYEQENKELKQSLLILEQTHQDIKDELETERSNARKEVTNWSRKWKEAVYRADAMSNSILEATQPFLKQLGVLQNEIEAKTKVWNGLEKTLQDQLQAQMAGKSELMAQLASVKDQMHNLRHQLAHNERDNELLQDKLERCEAERDQTERLLDQSRTEIKTLKRELVTQQGLHRDTELELRSTCQDQIEKLHRLQEYLAVASTREKELQQVVDSLREEVRAQTENEAAPNCAELPSDETLDIEAFDASPAYIYEQSQIIQQRHLMRDEIELLKQQLHSLWEKYNQLQAHCLDLETKHSDLEQRAVNDMEIKKRYPVLLELLGEKEEKVEELQEKLRALESLYKETKSNVS